MWLRCKLFKRTITNLNFEFMRAIFLAVVYVRRSSVQQSFGSVLPRIQHHPLRSKPQVYVRSGKKREVVGGHKSGGVKSETCTG